MTRFPSRLWKKGWCSSFFGPSGPKPGFLGAPPGLSVRGGSAPVAIVLALALVPGSVVVLVLVLVLVDDCVVGGLALAGGVPSAVIGGVATGAASAAGGG
jgi:hypothetical protein